MLMIWVAVGRFATYEALREIHRVLKPGGVFGMIWNIDDCENPPTTERHFDCLSIVLV